jgi:hypothetical protein
MERFPPLGYKSVKPAQLEKIRATCFFQTKAGIKLAKRSWVVFHTPTYYYILGRLEPTEYPQSSLFWQGRWNSNTGIKK